ncbi:hypothetical protein AX761_12740 [Rhizobium sp. 58]|nr:hypothetical protein AX761_12740 [Rhizobium sp. 58]
MHQRRTKAVWSGVASDTENLQNRQNDALSSSASASSTLDKSYQIDSRIVLNKAIGGQAGSPFAVQEITARD